jgi:SIR2-like domain
MRDTHWNLLLARVADGVCTPFLGAGAAAHALPLGSQIAERWASDFGYPLDDVDDLARVAQFVAVNQDDAMYPKELLCNELEELPGPDLDAASEPHAILAALPLPVFITTNYDNSMFEALARAGKDPRREICRWNRSPALVDEPSPFADPTYTPTPANPLVYHLHGRLGLPESLVLTEDDYLDFLVAVSRDPAILPHHIQRSLAGTSLLFIGYRLADWDFRVIHRGLVVATEASLRRLSVTVQLTEEDAAREYLDRYFSALKLRVYWGTAAAFADELQARWEAVRGGRRHG